MAARGPFDSGEARQLGPDVLGLAASVDRCYQASFAPMRGRASLFGARRPPGQELLNAAAAASMSALSGACVRPMHVGRSQDARRLSNRSRASSETV